MRYRLNSTIRFYVNSESDKEAVQKLVKLIALINGKSDFDTVVYVDEEKIKVEKLDF